MYEEPPAENVSEYAVRKRSCPESEGVEMIKALIKSIGLTFIFIGNIFFFIGKIFRRLLCYLLILCPLAVYIKTAVCALAHIGTPYITAERWTAWALFCGVTICYFLMALGVFSWTDDLDEASGCFFFGFSLVLLLVDLYVCIKKNPSGGGQILFAVFYTMLVVMLCFGVHDMLKKRLGPIRKEWEFIQNAWDDLMSGVDDLKTDSILECTNVRRLCRIANHSRNSVFRQSAVLRLQNKLSEIEPLETRK